MRRIVRREDGKKALLDTKKDTLLYDAYHAAWKRRGTDRGATRGIDLFHHKCKDGVDIFYLFHWSRWQGESSWIEPIDQDKAAAFVEENADYFDKEDIEQLRALGLYPDEEELL